MSTAWGWLIEMGPLATVLFAVVFGFLGVLIAAISWVGPGRKPYGAMFLVGFVTVVLARIFLPPWLER